TYLTIEVLITVGVFIFFWLRFYLDHFWTRPYLDRYRSFISIYHPLYWGLTFLVIIPTTYACIYEIMHHQLYRYPALRAFAMRATIAVGALAALFAFLADRHYQHMDRSSRMHEYLAAQRTFECGQLTLLVGVIALSFCLRIPWKPYSLAIAAGFVVQSGAVITIAMVQSMSPLGPVCFPLSSEVELALELIPLVIWAVAFRRQRTETSNTFPRNSMSANVIAEWNWALSLLLIRRSFERE